MGSTFKCIFIEDMGGGKTNVHLLAEPNDKSPFTGVVNMICNEDHSFEIGKEYQVNISEK